MTDRPEETPDASAAKEEVAQSKLVPQLTMMFRALLHSPVRNTLFILAGILVALVGATAYGQIRLNTWNQPFYDAIERHNLHAFFHQLAIFGMIAGGLLVLNVGQRWLNEMLKLKLREGLAKDLIENWLQPMRAFRLASAGPIGVNPDQRMHEDARHLTELSADLGTGLLQAGILLALSYTFCGGYRSNFAFHIGGHTYEIPGYMVWAAVLYAGSASLLSYWVGRASSTATPSVMRVKRTCDSRSSASTSMLMPLRSRAASRTRSAVSSSMLQRACGNQTPCHGPHEPDLGDGWLWMVHPRRTDSRGRTAVFLKASLSFGGLMMAAGAFTQVQTSMRWFVDNFSVIADWRATLLRVASFRRAILCDRHAAQC